MKDAARSTDNAPVPPLPWHWFEFRETPARWKPGQLAAAPESAAQRVWQVELDGSPVLFKYFRNAAAGTNPRPALMLLHGMGLTIASFRAISGYLFQSHDLILPDYSGLSFGGTVPAITSVKAFANIVWRVADTLGIQELSLGGNSLGGGLCLMATLLHLSRVERLLLANPACFPQALPRMYRIARVPLLGEFFMTITPPEKFVGGVEYIGYVDKNRFDPALRSVYLGNLSQRQNRFRLMQMIRQLPADARDLTSVSHLPRLREITQPVLLTSGEQDPLLVPGAAARLAAELPNVIFDSYPDLAHMPHEEAPDRVGLRWAAFLQGKLVVNGTADRRRAAPLPDNEPRTAAARPESE